MAELGKDFSGPEPVGDMVTQTLTDCRKVTLNSKERGFCASPLLLQTLRPWFPNKMFFYIYIKRGFLPVSDSQVSGSGGSWHLECSICTPCGICLCNSCISPLPFRFPNIPEWILPENSLKGPIILVAAAFLKFFFSHNFIYTLVCDSLKKIASLAMIFL